MSSIGGRLARDSVWMISVQVFGRGLALLFSLYAAKVLGVEQFGLYGYLMAIIVMVGTFVDFGANIYQVRQTASLSDETERRRLLTSAVTIRSLLGLLGVGALVVIALNMSGDKNTGGLLLLFAAGMLFNTINGAFTYTLMGREMFGLYGIISIISQTINVGSACLLLYLGWGIKGIAYTYSGLGLLVLIVTPIIVSLKAYSPSIKISIEDIKNFLRNAAPIGLTAILVVVYYKSDYIILEYFKGKSDVGLYNAAYVIINAMIFLPTTISTTLLPKLSYFLKENEDKLDLLYRTAFKFLFFAGFGLGFGTIAVSSKLITKIYPNDYYAAYAVLNILIWNLSLIFINSMQGNMIIAIGKQKLMPLITGSACVVNIVLNFILIPSFGMKGAAIATVTAEIVAGTGCFIVLRRRNRIGHLIPIILKTAIAGSVMYVYLTATANLSLFIRIPTGIIVYFALLIIVKGISRMEISPLAEVFRRG